MANTITTELELKIYDDKSGEFYSVTADADGLDMVDIRQCDRDGKIENRLTITSDQAHHISQALARYVREQGKGI